MRARDARGAVEAGVVVRFALIAGGASLGSPEAITDAEGLARTTFVGSAVSPSESWSAQVVRATREGAEGAASVDVPMTTHDTGDGIPRPPWVGLSSPASRDLGAARRGAVLPGAVEVQVAAQAGPFSGRGIPGVRVRAEPEDVARCANDALSDDHGVARCDLEIVGEPGDRSFSVIAGDAIRYDGVRVRIE